MLEKDAIDNDAIEIIRPTKIENKNLHSLDDKYIEVSEMTNEEREFLSAVILRNKPHKLLELGVGRGGSSIVMLNAIKDMQDTKLYSIDLNEMWYRTREVKTGYYVNNYPELKRKWELFTGGLALKFMDQIGNDIDLCLIDTVHSNPGEIFDYLMVLPYLKDNAIVILHDTKYHCSIMTQAGITNNLLMSSIYGKKYIQGNYISGTSYGFPNIGGIKLNAETKRHIFEVFNLLTIKWSYQPNDTQKADIINYFSRFYNEEYIEYLRNVFTFQHNLNQNYSIRLLPMYKNVIKATIKKILGKKIVEKIKAYRGREGRHGI